MRSEAFFICSHGAYTIFLPGEAENTTFPIGCREQKWHFRPARQKNLSFSASFLVFGIFRTNSVSVCSSLSIFFHRLCLYISVSLILTLYLYLYVSAFKTLTACRFLSVCLSFYLSLSSVSVALVLSIHILASPIAASPAL